MLNILKALTLTKWGKQKELIVSTSYHSLHFGLCKTPYEALLYKTQTSRNCKLVETKLCKVLLAAPEIQILNIFMTKPTSF